MKKVLIFILATLNMSLVFYVCGLLLWLIAQFVLMLLNPDFGSIMSHTSAGLLYFMFLVLQIVIIFLAVRRGIQDAAKINTKKEWGSFVKYSHITIVNQVGLILVSLLLILQNGFDGYAIYSYALIAVVSILVSFAWWIYSLILIYPLPMERRYFMKTISLTLALSIFLNFIGIVKSLKILQGISKKV